MWRNNLDVSQTIFALTSGTLPSAVAIEKISGQYFANREHFANRLFRSKNGPLERERGMVYGELIDLYGNKIDDALALVFPGPHSHTGEDVVEFHFHGSKAIHQKLEECLLALGARPAQRGEFSYRALLNGKTTPADLENLGDVYLSQQPADLERIYARRDGALEKRISSLRGRLIQLQAILDTSVDFSEEYSSVVNHVEPVLSEVIHECSLTTQRFSAFRGGVSVPRLALIGRPNAGKSSLFNALLCRYRAIVHHEAGTTRDVIEEDVAIGGRKWKIVDTAGMHSAAQSEVEQEGIALGSEFLQASSGWLLVVDGSVGMTDAEVHLLRSFADKPHWIIWNKTDLPEWKRPSKIDGHSYIELSAKDATGLDVLWNELEKGLGNLSVTEGPLPTAVQNARLLSVLTTLAEFEKSVRSGEPPEILAERNRKVIQQLEGVTGLVETEDVLDRIFSDFCIGK